MPGERPFRIMPSRYVCSVLDEVRTALKVGRIDMVLGLVEEVQTLVNRMEAKLADYSDMGYDLKRARGLRKRIAEIERSIEKAESKVGIEEEDEGY